VPRYGYRLGVPRDGFWREVANSDASDYGGSGVGNLGGCEAQEVPSHGHPYSIEATLPPLGAVFFKQPQRIADGPSPRPSGRPLRGTGDLRSRPDQSVGEGRPLAHPRRERGEGERPGEGDGEP
jgi:hypothetical protein